MIRMRPARVFARLLASATLCCALATPAFAQDKQTKTGAPAKAPIPAEVRARVVSKMDGARPEDVSGSPIPGVYEVTVGGMIVYVTADGKYLFSGNLYDLDTQQNLTAERRSTARARALAAASEGDMIIFSPSNPKMTVTVFTDVDCQFCRRFHTQIADLNKAGVRVRYVLYPRTGPGTQSWKEAEAVWCSKDRREALTRAKRGEEIKVKPCADGAKALKAQYQLGDDLGIEGTPAIFTQTGDYIGGYMTPAELVNTVAQTQKAAAAAAP
jgi:thiol:disulfide interchange protein DsbC